MNSNRSSNRLQLKNNYRMYEGGDEKEKSVASRASKRSSRKSQQKKTNPDLSSKNLTTNQSELSKKMPPIP